MTSTRPGSLTLLAILNFIGAGFGLLGCLGQVVVLLFMRDHEAGAALAQIPGWWQALSLTGNVLSVALLVVSGIGMLRLSPRWGRWGATAYALLAIGLAVGDHLVVTRQAPAEAAGGAPLALLGTVIGLLYPVMVLVWVHGVVADVWHPPVIRPATGPGRSAVHPVLLTLGHALRQSLRGVSGPAFILGLVLTGLLTCFAILGIATFADQALPEARPFHAGMIEQGTAKIIGFVTGETVEPVTAPAAAPAANGSQRWARHLVVDHPPILSFTWLILSCILPVAVVFASSGLIARDTASRGFRFLLTRIDRRALFLGRFAAAAALTSAVVVLLVAACGVLAWLARPDIGFAAAAGWSAWAAVALVLISLPYLALGLLASSLIGHPFAALSAAQGMLIGWPLLALSLAGAWAPLKHSVHLLPLAVQFYLFHPAPLAVGLAALACLAYTALFLWLGCAHFRARDL